MKRHRTRLIPSKRNSLPPEPEVWDMFHLRDYNAGGPLERDFADLRARATLRVDTLKAQLVIALEELRRLNMGAFTRTKSKSKGNNGVALLMAVDKGKLNAAMLAVINGGHVIQFGQTKAGNALVIGVYDGKENDKVYPETIEELDDTLDVLLDAYDASYQPPPKSKVVKSKAQEDETTP